MLTRALRSILPHRPATTASLAASIRLRPGLAAGIFLFAAGLFAMAAVLRNPAEPDAAMTGAIAQTAANPTTDGRAVSELGHDENSTRMSDPIVSQINPDCALLAHERLMSGLTNYYLQRRLRPGATSDDAAETSSLTGVLAGPGDPAATTPESSCRA